MKLQALNLNKMLNFNKKRAVHRLKSTLNRFFSIGTYLILMLFCKVYYAVAIKE